MTQQQENLSAFIDGELTDQSNDVIDGLKHDQSMRDKWQRYHLIRDGLRGELPSTQGIDIAAAIAQAIDNEPAIVAPKRTWKELPVVASVVPLVRQSGQFLVAASVAAVVILGVQNYNHQDLSEPFTTAPTITGPQGNLTPVSLEQTRSVSRTDARNDMAALLEQRRLINALIADHQRQLEMKQSHPFDEQRGDNTDAQTVDKSEQP